MQATFVLSLTDPPRLLQTRGEVAGLLGHTASAFSSGSVSLQGCVHADDHDITAMLMAPQGPASTGVVNLRLRQASGRIRCVRGEYRRQPGEAGTPMRLELDLFDAKSLPRTLDDAALTANFRAMMDNTGDYVFFKDRNHVFTGASQSLVTLCDPAEHWTDVIGQTDYDVFPEALADHYYRLEKQIYSGQRVAREVQETLAKDGRKGWVDNRKYPILDAQGLIVGLYGMARDITEQVRARQALQDSEARYRSLYAAMIEGMAVHELVLDALDRPADYRILDANPAFEAHTGLHRADIVGRLATEVYGVDKAPFLDLYASVARGGQAVVFDEYFPPMGKHFLISVFSPGPLQFVTVFQDITESKRAEAELQHHRRHLQTLVQERTAALAQALEAAHAATRAKSAFLANMSHEIRTPINAILGLAALMRRQSADAEFLVRTDQISSAGAHLLGIIDDILDLSKIEAGKLELDDQPLDVHAIVAEVVAMLGQRARDKQLALASEVQVPPRTLSGDAMRMRQALLNYVANAIKFTEAGRVDIRVSVASEVDGKLWLRFEVSDTGIGIAPEALQRLFGSFEQADNSTTRRFGGTGLGLAITRRLAELMHGEAGARSQPGGGSSFWFTARLSAPEAASRVDAGAADHADAERVLRQTYALSRVLLVEDEPINREITTLMLEDVGLRVDLACDGVQAVESAGRGSYALVLMDMQMPRMDGLEATRRIRALPQHATTPIVAMTANVFSEDKARCLEAGMNGFIGKPVNPADLYRQVLDALSGARAKPATPC